MVRLWDLSDHANVWCLSCPGLSMEGKTFDWFAVCVLSPEWLCLKLELRDVREALIEATAPV